MLMLTPNHLLYQKGFLALLHHPPRSMLDRNSAFGSCRAPPAVKQALNLAVSYFTSTGDFLPGSPPNGPMQEHLSLPSSGPMPPTGLPLSCADGEILTGHNIQLNRQTTLETVYYYPPTRWSNIQKPASTVELDMFSL
jgi:hypothetical protein